jgi:hypothetical protein
MGKIPSMNFLDYKRMFNNFINNILGTMKDYPRNMEKNTQVGLPLE